MSDAIEVLGWTLLHFVWQGALVGVLAATLLIAMRRRSANARYLIAVSALGLMLVLPLVTIAWIERESPGETSPIVMTKTITEMPRTRDDGTPALDEPPIPVERIGIDFENPPPAAAVPLIPVSESGQTLLEESSEKQPGFNAESFFKPLIPWTVAAWLIGVGLLSLRLFGSWWSVQRLRRRASQPAKEAWQASLARLAERLRVSRPVKLAESSLVEVPAVIGWLRPVILLPATAMTGLTTEQVEALLAHELAHVRRHDYLVNLLQTVVETLLFYHPAVWWLSHRIRVEREHCCDDLAASVCGDRLSYAKALMAMEELRAPALGLVVSSRGGSLIARIRRLMGNPERPANGKLATVVLTVVLLLLVGVAVHLRQAVSASDERLQKSASETDVAITSLDQLIAKVREQEARFENLDISVRTTRQFQIATGDAAAAEGLLGNADKDTPRVGVTLDSNYRAVTSPGRLWFMGDDVATHPGREPSRIKRKTVFDGEQTVSIEEGNSIAVHHGKHEPAQLLPAHALPLFSLEVNFPLSAYLEGTEALKSQPKIQRFSSERGSIFEFPKVEAEFVGEESLDELDCIVVKVKRWYYTRSSPQIQRLWLAKLRNFHVAQVTTATFKNNVETPSTIGRVTKWQELSSGVWLPKIVDVESAAPDPKGVEQTHLSRRLVAWKATLNPVTSENFFKLPEIPDDLPKFEISTDRRLVGSPHHPKPAEGSTPTTLDAIIERLADEEKKYFEIDISTTTDYRHLNHNDLIGGGGIVATSLTRERTIESSGRAFYEKVIESHSSAGDYTSRQQQTFDGRWTRSKNATRRDDGANQSFASVDLRNTAERALLRPHTLIAYRPAWASLTTALRTGVFESGSSSKTDVTYLGDDVIDSLVCHKLHCEPVRSRPTERQTYFLIWLARDRNLIPIRYEWHDHSLDASIPTGQHYVEEFRELRPGVWFPIRVTHLAFQKFGREVFSRPLIQWRSDVTADRVQFDPKLDERFFSTIEIPEGTTVGVRDEQGKSLGNFVTEQPGPLDVTPEQLAELRQQAQERQEAAGRQKKERDAQRLKDAANSTTEKTELREGLLTAVIAKAKSELESTFQKALYELDQMRGQKSVEEIEAFGESLLKEFGDQPERAGRIRFQLAHVFAQSDIREHFGRVRKYGELALKDERDPDRRATLHSYLGSAAQVDASVSSFVERRRNSVKVWLEGYRELLPLKLPRVAPELPVVEKTGDVVGEEPAKGAEIEKRHAEQMEARRKAEFLRTMVGHRQVFARQIVEVYRREPAADDELRQLAIETLKNQRLVDALLSEGLDRRVGEAQPRIEWLDKDDKRTISGLNVELVPSFQVEATPSGLKGFVRIANQSPHDLSTKLAHEWHGGEWPPTGLYASVTPWLTLHDAPFRPAYLFGENEGKATEPLMVPAGQSSDISVRLDWPGTGSVPATPLIDPKQPGKYRVRWLLVFDSQGGPQYVVGHSAKIEYVNIPANPERDAQLLELKRHLPKHWFAEIEGERTIALYPGIYATFEDRPLVLLVFSDGKQPPQPGDLREEAQHEYLGPTKLGHAHLFVSMKFGDEARLTKPLRAMFEWPECVPFFKAFVSGDAEQLEAEKAKAAKRVAAAETPSAGRGSPDPALKPTEGLPNQGKDNQQDKGKAGDLRSEPASGSGDPRRAPVRGEILWVDQNNNLVRISLGVDDGIKTRMKFKVRTKSDPDAPAPAPVEKGTIEIIRLIDRNTSEARILGLIQNNAPVKGDEVVPAEQFFKPTEGLPNPGNDNRRERDKEGNLPSDSVSGDLHGLPPDRVVALVNGVAIHEADVTDCYSSQLKLEQTRQAPEQLRKMVDELIRRDLPTIIERKLLVAEAMKFFDAKQRQEVDEFIHRQLAEQAAAMMKDSGVANRDELQNWLRQQGTSLERVESEFKERFYAQQFLAKKLESAKTPEETDKLQNQLLLQLWQQAELKSEYLPRRGKIRWVDRPNERVWINLGEADGIKRGSAFRVISLPPNNDPAQPIVIKGKIVVTRIIDRNTAEARILESDNDGPEKGNEVIPAFSDSKPSAVDRSLLIPFRKHDEDKGRFVGRVRLKTEKPLPDLEKVDVPAGKVLDESLVFSKDGGLANVFVYPWKPKVVAAQPSEAGEPFVLKSDVARFSPRGAIIRVGQTIVVDNRLSAETTNVRTSPIKDDPLNYSVAGGDSVKAKPFRVPGPIPVSVKSDVQPWKQAWVLPLDHPFAAVTDASGSFAIEGLPPGDYEFRVWHERVGYLEKSLRVTIKAGEEAKVDLSFGASTFKLDEADVLNWGSRGLLTPPRLFGRDQEARSWRRLQESETVLWHPAIIAFESQSLSDVLQQLSEAHKIPFVLDDSAKGQAGARITIRTDGEYLVEVLPRILHQAGLSYGIDTNAERILIATPAELSRSKLDVLPSFGNLLEKLSRADSTAAGSNKANLLPWEKLLMGDATALGKTRDEQTVQVNRLTKLLASSDPDIQIASAAALARFQSTAAPARPELEKLIENRNWKVRQAASHSLYAIRRDELDTLPKIVDAWELVGKTVSPADHSRQWQLQPGILARATELYPTAPVELRRRLVDVTKVWWKGRRESQALIRLCWNDSDEPTRFAALGNASFGLFDDLREHLKDESARCRVQAARWLVHSEPDRGTAVDLLLKEFGTEPPTLQPTETQQLVIDILSEQGKNQHRTHGHLRDVLLRRSVSDNAELRAAARRALLLVPESTNTTSVQAALTEEFAALRKSRDQGRLTDSQAARAAVNRIDEWLANTNPTDEDQARMNHHAAHTFAQWDIRQHSRIVTKYAEAALKLDVDTARRASLHVLLGSAALVDPTAKSFVEQRPIAAKHWLTGYRELSKLNLPKIAPELPIVEKLGDVSGESPEARAAREQRHVAQLKARQQAEFIRTMVEHRHQLARLCVETYQCEPANESELRKLATEPLNDKSLVDALLAEGAMPLGENRTPPVRDAQNSDTKDKLLKSEVSNLKFQISNSKPEETRRAIEQGIAFLKAQQQENGTWQGNPLDGVTALCAAALLQAGVKTDDPTMQKAVGHLRKIEPNFSYTVALQTMVFCWASPKEDAELIRRNVAWLEKAQASEGTHRGAWSYVANNTSHLGDGSCSRFAVLGLDAAKRTGFEVKEETWKRVSDYWLKHQKDDGGWSYMPEARKTPAMTLAGMACLATANRFLPPNDQTKTREAAIRRPTDYLEERIPEWPKGTFPFYTLHSLERAGHLSGLKEFGKLDWKTDTTKRLLETQGPNGSWKGNTQTESELVATSFALLVLTGRPEQVQSVEGVPVKN